MSSIIKWLLFCYLGSAVCSAQESKVSVSLATLAIAGESDGLVYLRTGEKETTAVQLNKSTFTKPINITSGQVEIYQRPLDPDPDSAQQVAPLLIVKIPSASSEASVLVWSVKQKRGEVKWYGRAYDSSKWPDSSMILANFTPYSLGFKSGNLKQTIAPNATFVFKGKNEKNGSPAKLFILDPKSADPTKLVFSSVWRVPENEQELFVIYPGRSENTVMTRSFMLNREKREAEKE